MQKIKDLISTVLAKLPSLVSENIDFFDAVHYENYDEVKKLLKHSKVNSFSKAGKTPLDYACSNLDVKMVDLLLEHGANPNVYGEKPALIYVLDAAQNWHTVNGLAKDVRLAMQENQDKSFTIVEKLVNAKADLRYVDKNKTDLLMFAAYSGNNEVVELFLQKGLDPQARSKYQYNAFHYALASQNINTVKLLCEATKSQKELYWYQKQIPDDHAFYNETQDFIRILSNYRTLDNTLKSKIKTKALKI